MGKYKFRFSDMVPNAWFYKLRDMGHNRRKNQKYTPRESSARKSFTSPYSPKLSSVSNRASYYYSTAVIEARKNLNSPAHITKRLDVDLPLNTPRKSKRMSHRRHCKLLINSPSRQRVSTSTSFRCNCSNGSDKCEKDATENYETFLSYSEMATGITGFNSDTERKLAISTKLDNTKSSSHMIELALSPIRTRSDQVFKKNDNSSNTEYKRPHLKMKRASKTVRIRTPVVSPKIGIKNVTKEKKLTKDLKESLVVKVYSSDMQRDFTESMIEMIIANDMRSWSELEDLLACYLTLNSVDYHSVIVKVFKQVLLDLSRLRIIEQN